MGVVYTPEQVQANHIPDAPDSHYAAASEVIARTEEFGWEGLVYGSTAIDQPPAPGPSIRSDLDFLTIYPQEDLVAAVGLIRQLVRDVYSRWHVRIEHNAIPDKRLSPSVHTIDELVLIHLEVAESESQYKTGHPVERIADGIPRPTDNIAVIRRYLASKHSKFMDGGTELYPDRFRVLQRAFELPKSIATKLFVLSRFDKQEHTKEQIQAILTELFDEARQPTDALEALAILNTEYDQVLESTISGNTSIDEYSVWISGVYTSAVDLAVRGVDAAINTVNHVGRLEPVRDEVYKLFR